MKNDDVKTGLVKEHVHNPNLVNEREHETAVALANAAELGAQLIRRIAGNDVSTAINNTVLTREVIQNLICRKIVERAKKA